MIGRRSEIEAGASAASVTAESALRAACLMLSGSPPSLVRAVALSVGLQDTREAWRMRAYADALALEYDLTVEVRASDRGVLVRIGRRPEDVRRAAAPRAKEEST